MLYWTNRVALAGLVIGVMGLGHKVRADDSAPYVHLDVPLIEAPMHWPRGQLAWPTMRQSVMVIADAVQLSHFALAQVLDPYAQRWWQRGINRTATVLADLLLSVYVPGFGAWNHEEWHRSVLRRFGIPSHNGVYAFKWDANVIPVDQVLDEDLAQLKRKSNPDFVRLSTAGIEGDTYFADALERRAFFNGTRAWDWGTVAVSFLGGSLYLRTCSQPTSSRELEDEIGEGTAISKRDFTGYDCRGAVYDMFNPDEAYEQRGIHPSGTGIRRYRRLEDLSPNAQSYLRRQAALSWLNFVDGMIIGELLGRRHIHASGYRVTGNLRYYQTPFGNSIDLNVWLAGPRKFAVTFHRYGSQQQILPGLTLASLEVPLSRLGEWAQDMMFSTSLSGWFQPAHLRFETNARTFGGGIEARVDFAATHFVRPYLEIEAKTSGWVAGNVELSRGIGVRFGFASNLP
jgi:hypothetical protein